MLASMSAVTALALTGASMAEIARAQGKPYAPTLGQPGKDVIWAPTPDAMVDRMLRLGASTEMVSRFYGLTHQEVALRREILGLPKRKGRHPVLDETQDTELWRQWKAVTSSRNVDLEDETSILDAAMDLAEGMSLPLPVVWAAIRNWVDQGLD